MPTRLLLEGNDIHALLAQVRAEHGTAAKIVAADRVRATGLAGLFSRQRFELTIEVADPPAIEAPAGPADALIALIEAQERLLAPVPAPYIGPDESASADGAMRAAQQVSAEAAAFADVLSGFGVPGWSTPAVAPTPPAAPPIMARPVPAAPIAPAAPFVAAIPAPIGNPAVDGPLIPRYQPITLPADATLPAVLNHLGLPAQLGERVTGVDSYRAIVKVLKLLPEAPKAPTRGGDVLVIVGELRSAVAVARKVSESLCLTPARTVLAAASCAGTGIHPSRRLAGPEQAAKRIAKLRRTADLPVIVVVDAPSDRTGAEWAGSIMDSFDATAVWAVVDATRKTADSARRLADLGRVDAIVAESCTATADPATVLQLGVPVALLDGRPATPHAWAELLCRRLEEELP